MNLKHEWVYDGVKGNGKTALGSVHSAVRLTMPLAVMTNVNRGKAEEH